MTRKDRVVHATDQISEALKALVRINYSNPEQTENNISAASELLLSASRFLVTKEERGS